MQIHWNCREERQLTNVLLLSEWSKTTCDSRFNAKYALYRISLHTYEDVANKVINFVHTVLAHRPYVLRIYCIVYDMYKMS